MGSSECPTWAPHGFNKRHGCHTCWVLLLLLLRHAPKLQGWLRGSPAGQQPAQSGAAAQVCNACAHSTAGSWHLAHLCLCPHMIHHQREVALLP